MTQARQSTHCATTTCFVHTHRSDPSQRRFWSLLMLLCCGLQVKENFERFISCKSTIDDIHVRLRKAEGDYGDSADGASTADMVAAVTDVIPLTHLALH